VGQFTATAGQFAKDRMQRWFGKWSGATGKGLLDISSPVATKPLCAPTLAGGIVGQMLGELLRLTGTLVEELNQLSIERLERSLELRGWR
jgi:hypothetical protein